MIGKCYWEMIRNWDIWRRIKIFLRSRDIIKRGMERKGDEEGERIGIEVCGKDRKIKGYVI